MFAAWEGCLARDATGATGNNEIHTSRRQLEVEPHHATARFLCLKYGFELDFRVVRFVVSASSCSRHRNRSYLPYNMISSSNLGRRGRYFDPLLVVFRMSKMQIRTRHLHQRQCLTSSARGHKIRHPPSLDLYIKGSLAVEESWIVCRLGGQSDWRRCQMHETHNTYSCSTSLARAPHGPTALSVCNGFEQEVSWICVNLSAPLMID